MACSEPPDLLILTVSLLGHHPRPTVSALAVHQALEVKRPFTSWLVSHLNQGDWIEHIDFLVVTPAVPPRAGAASWIMPSPCHWPPTWPAGAAGSPGAVCARGCCSSAWRGSASSRDRPLWTRQPLNTRTSGSSRPRVCAAVGGTARRRRAGLARPLQGDPFPVRNERGVTSTPHRAWRARAGRRLSR